MRCLILAILIPSGAFASTSYSHSVIQPVLIVGTDTAPSGATYMSNVVLPINVLGGVLVSSNVAFTNVSNTFISSQTINNTAGLKVVGGSVTANAFFGDGSSVTNINASSVSAGTLSDSRLSSNVVLINSAQTITGGKTFTSSTTIINTNGLLISGGSVTANAFFGDGSHLSGISIDSNTFSGILPVAKGGTQVGTLTSGGVLIGQGTSPVQSYSTFTLTGAGNVGIGTASPSATLEVLSDMQGAPNVTITNGPTHTAGGLQVGTNFNNSGARNWAISATNNAFGDLVFRVGASSGTSPYTGSTIMEMLSNGNVGIGTTNPNAILELLGTGSKARFSYDATHYSTLNTDVSGNAILSSSNHLIYLGASSSDYQQLAFYQGPGGTPGGTPSIRADYDAMYITNAGGKIIVEKAADEGHALGIQEPAAPYQAVNWWYDGSSAGGTGMWLHTGANAGNINLELGDAAGTYAVKVLDTNSVTMFEVKTSSHVRLAARSGAPVTCNSANKGSVYFDASGAFCGCDGTSWGKFSGAGSCP